MLFFGYIVTDIKYKDLEEDIVKVVNSLEECTIHLPKLIIGLDNAKKYAIDNGWEFDILEHTYPNGDMWTFKKTEKREFYNEDLLSFKKMVIETQGDGLYYHYVNLYTLKFNKIKKLYNILFNNFLNKSTNYIIIDKDMLYMSLRENCVIGISFRHLQYVGIEREKVINHLKASANNKVYYTTSRNMWKFKEWFIGKEYVIARIFARFSKKN